MYPQQPHDEPLYQQLPPQVIYVQPPAEQRKRTDRPMKVLAICFISVGLGLALLSTMPTYGVLFGLLWFFCDAVGLVFICLT